MVRYIGGLRRAAELIGIMRVGVIAVGNAADHVQRVQLGLFFIILKKIAVLLGG